MSLTLGDYRKLLGDLVVDYRCQDNRPISTLSYHSQQVEEGTLFLCKGEQFREAYLQDAQQRGAVCYLAEQCWNQDTDYILVQDIRLAMAQVITAYYQNHSQNIPLIGITGTKGKTTTALLLRSIFDAHCKQAQLPPSALLCSVLTYDGVAEEPSRLTTKEPLELNQHIANAIRSACPYLTMEVSSQAVKYHRSYGLDFAMGCYLNIGEDHISPMEHPDFQDYFQSKLQFFPQCKALSVHLDGIHTQQVLDAVPKDCSLVTCSRHNTSADFHLLSYERQGMYTHFTVHTPRGVETYQLPMAGLFNLDNAISAISMAHQFQIPLTAIQEGLRLGRVAGRMELYHSKDEKIHILVDYAHNKMSFQALFSSIVEEFPHKKRVAVFGCPGEKALDRREDMGKIADQYADYSILTEDDPANERIENICADISSHMGQGNYHVQPDRCKAIEEACNLFPEEEKVVMLLGKGAESDQKRGSLYVKHPTDSQLAQAFLSAYDQMSQI